MAALVHTPVATNPNSMGMGGLSSVTLDNPYEPWLGPISTQALQDTSSYGRPQTIRNLPEFYKGRNVRLLSFIEEQIFFNDQFLTQVVIPLEETDDMNWEWNIWKFNHHLLQPVPFQGVSRFITNETASGRKSTTRYGIAFTLEHGFMNTEAGRTNYYYNLRTIANSVNETHNFDILRGLISAPQESEMFAAKRSFYSSKTFQDIMDMERDMWALLQKDADGFKKMDTETIERMKFNQGDADTWLIPPKMQYYLQLVPRENTEYNIAGDVGPKRRANNYSYDSPNAFKEFGDARVYFIRQFNYDHHQNVDAMARFREIGEFNKLLPTGAVDPQRYTKKERDIVVYNEDKDDWHKFTLNDAIDNCMMFKKNVDGGLSFLEHPTFTMLEREYRANPFFMESSNRGTPLDGDEDMDSSNSHWRPIELFGQMAARHFKSSTQVDMAHTILRKVSNVLGTKTEGAIEKLLEAFEKINDVTWANRIELHDWFAAITGRGNGVTADNLLGNLTTVKPASERLYRFAAFPALKYNLTTGDSIMNASIPGGIGQTNWVGLQGLISNADRSFIGPKEIYEEGKSTIQSLVRHLNRILRGCLLTDKTRTPGHLPIQSQETVFMETALGISGFPVWINAGVSNDDLLTFIDNSAKGKRAKSVSDGTISAEAAAATSLDNAVSNGVDLIKELAGKINRLFNDADVKLAFETFVGAAVPSDTAAMFRTQPSAPTNEDKEKMRLAGTVYQLAKPLSPYPKKNPNMVSFESLQRFLNFVDILRVLDFRKIEEHVGAKGRFTQFLRSLLDTIYSKINRPADSLLGNVTLDNLRAAVGASSGTSEIDEALFSWLSDYAAQGWFDFGYGNTADYLELFIQTQRDKIRMAANKDRRFYSAGIYPRFGIIGLISENDVRNKSFPELVKKINETSTGAAPPADNNFFLLGEKFGEDDDRDIGKETFAHSTNAGVSWVRTTLSLSAVQVASLYQLQYQTRGYGPGNLVTVSFPDSPEAPATPSELASFFDLYERNKAGDVASLPKNALTGLIMEQSQKLQFIELMDVYSRKQSSKNYSSHQLVGKTKKRLYGASQGSFFEDFDADLANDGPATKRRRVGERDMFGSVGGPNSGVRSSSSMLGTDNDVNVPLLTSDLTDHWSAANNLGQTNLVKAIIRSILMTPFTAEALRNLNENDCIVPVGFYIFAPHMVYLTLLAIKVLAGERTGTLKVGHRDFEIGNNPKTKTFYGHFTLHSAVVITGNQNVFVAYDVFVKGCYGGAGVRFWNADNAHLYNPEEDETSEADRFSIMVSYEEDHLEESCNPMDASGYFSYLKTPGLVDSYEASKPHYSTAGWYNNFWKFRTTDAFRMANVSALPLHHPWHENSEFRQFNHNTVMWLGPQAYYNPHSEKYDLLKPGTGHWGENGYGPGARAVRNGDLKGFKSFDQIARTIYIR